MLANEEYRDLIKKIFNRYFPIEDQSIDKLISLSKITKLQKGETLLEYGRIARQLHILQKGIVVSYFIDEKGDLYHKNIFLEEDFVASTVSALKREPSNFGLKTIEESTLISFNYKKFKELIYNNSDLMRFYISYLEMNWVIEKEKREIDIVMKEASERYQAFIQSNLTIENRVPLHYIASHLGITPTQLSRIRKKKFK